MSKHQITRRHALAMTGGIAGGIALGAGLPATRAYAAAQSDAKEFKVGAVLELSGADASGGHLCRRGYEFGVAEINKQGGVEVAGKKYPIRLLVQDARSEPAAGADAASRLITEEHVDAMLGAYSSGVQLAMNPICAKYQVTCIAGSAESPENWSPHPEYTFGIIPSVDLTAGKALGFLVAAGNPRPTTCAVIGANEPFSKDAAAGFAAGAKELGLKLTINTLFPPDADLTPIMSKIAIQKPDIVAVGAHDTILIDAVKALKSQGFTPKALIEHYGVTEDAFVKALGAEANGVCGLVDWLPSFPYKDAVFGNCADVLKNYQAMFHVDIEYTGAACAVSNLVLATALGKLGKPPGLSREDRVALNKIVAATDLQTFYGPVKFDQSGPHFHDNSGLAPVLIQIQNGQITGVAPPNLAEAKFIYPLTAI